MTLLTKQWWSRWVAEYLPTLQTRSKWRSENPGTWAIGDLVLVAEDNLTPMHWPLARITALHTGNDGHIRAVRVQIATRRVYKTNCENSPPSVQRLIKLFQFRHNYQKLL